MLDLPPRMRIRHHQDLGEHFSATATPNSKFSDPKKFVQFLQVAIQGTLEAKKTLRQPLETLGSPVPHQLYQQTKVAHLTAWWPFFSTAIPSRGFCKEKLPGLMVQVENGAVFHDFWEKGSFLSLWVFFWSFTTEPPALTWAFSVGSFPKIYPGCLMKGSI